MLATHCYSQFYNITYSTQKKCKQIKKKNKEEEKKKKEKQTKNRKILVQSHKE